TTGSSKEILINDRAVGTDQSKKFVLVVGENNMLEYREIQLGGMAEGLRVVAGGLKAGETIVVNGLQRVRPGMPVTPQVVPMDAPEASAEQPTIEAPAGEKPEEEVPQGDS